jgi:hypothetical protein
MEVAYPDCIILQNIKTPVLNVPRRTRRRFLEQHLQEVQKCHGIGPENRLIGSIGESSPRDQYSGAGDYRVELVVEL